MGRALTLLQRGDRVVVVGTDSDKGRSVLDAAREIGAGDRIDFVLSRYLLGHGLVDHMNRAAAPGLLNLARPGTGLAGIRWDDLQFARNDAPDEVMAQAGKLGDLLGVGFARQHPDSDVRYVLLHPGLTATGFTGQYDATSAEIVAGMRERAQPLTAALPRLLRHLDQPPAPPLSAFTQDTEVDVHGASFDPQAADRLAAITADLLQSV